MSIGLFIITLVLAAGYALLHLTLLSGGPWFEWFDGSREPIVLHVLIGFVAAAGLLVLFIPLICWRKIHKWWRSSQYVAEQLR